MSDSAWVHKGGYYERWTDLSVRGVVRQSSTSPPLGGGGASNVWEWRVDGADFMKCGSEPTKEAAMARADLEMANPRP